MDTDQHDPWFEDDVEDDGGIQIDLYDITASPNDFNLVTLGSFIDRGAVRIPGFQRHFVWDLPRASRLIESLILGLPAPQLFLFLSFLNACRELPGDAFRNPHDDRFNIMLHEAVFTAACGWAFAERRRGRVRCRGRKLQEVTSARRRKLFRTPNDGDCDVVRRGCDDLRLESRRLTVPRGQQALLLQPSADLRTPKLRTGCPE